MAYQVRTQALRLADGSSTPLTEIESSSGQRLVIAPQFGVNILSWREPFPGSGLELLWQDFSQLAPGAFTRQGIPILFPFANRIRDGRFTWKGSTWNLPLN